MRRTRMVLGFLLLVLWLVPAPLSTPVHELNASPLQIDPALLTKIDPSLLKEAVQAKDGRLRFIVHLKEQTALSAAGRGASKAADRAMVVSSLQDTAARSQRGILDELEGRRRKGSVWEYHSFWGVNAVAVQGDLAALLSMAGRPEVATVRADNVRYLPSVAPEAPTSGGLAVLDGGQVSSSSAEWNIVKVAADKVWGALGIDGHGVVVGTLDTGVDWQHPALKTKYRGYVNDATVNHAGNWFSATDEAYPVPTDVVGHGTHTMGTIVGSTGSDQIGMAPGAKWISAKVFNDQGVAYDSWIHAAFQWMLAPNGDPNLAPDVLSNSWGSEDGLDETFRQDILALQAAHIFVTFAAGNKGPSSGTVGSPASLPEGFAVGATDVNDIMALFSSRGPSPLGGIKPQVVAPGVSIRSSWPGGGYRVLSGTSMATPHVAGLAALLLSANPTLDLPGIGRAIMSSAIHLGASSPNNDYGWGRVDAYQAVSSVINAGTLTGRALDDGGAPVSFATVSVMADGTDRSLLLPVEQDGHFNLYLAAGVYTITGQAFGFGDGGPVRIQVDAGKVVNQDIVFHALPTERVYGRVVEESSGRPLAAMVVVSGTPQRVATDPATGLYDLSLPTGSYQLKVVSPEHRIGRDTVQITIGAPQSVEFRLATAPRILLVDSGAWYNASMASFFDATLDQLDYTYDRYTIVNAGQPPPASKLVMYDLVIWSSPEDSPGLLGEDQALQTYLGVGGRLLLSGQDVAYWDSGAGQTGEAKYLHNYLHARFIEDSSGSHNIKGVSDDIFAGLNLAMNSADSAQDQVSADIIAPANNLGTSVAVYDDGGGAALRTGGCLPYRGILLGFGLEGVGPASTRMDLMRQSIEWLMDEPPDHGLSSFASPTPLVAAAGQTVSTTVSIRNEGRLSDNYALSLSGGEWNASVWDASFDHTITSVSNLQACASATIGVKVEVPITATRNLSRTTDLVVRSGSDSSVTASMNIVAKTPADLMLVDDDRWYEMEDYYTRTLQTIGYQYDLWDTKGGDGPDARTLSMYPAVLWFTGYDWYEPLSTKDEANLQTYLDQGNNLLLSAQDHLFVSGSDSFTRGYLGVGDFANDVGAKSVAGAAGNALFKGIGPVPLTLPYPEWSDVVTPTAAAMAAFVNEMGDPIGVSVDNPGSGSRTVFLAFALEGVNDTTRGVILQRTRDWFGPLGSSTIRVSKERAEPSEELFYVVTLDNPTNLDLPVEVANQIHGGTVYVPASLTGFAGVSLSGSRITWAGTLPANSIRQFSYRVRIEAGFQGWIEDLVTIKSGDRVFRKTAVTLVPFKTFFPSVAKPAGGTR